MQPLAQISYTSPNGDDILFSINRDPRLEIVEISMYNSTHRYVYRTSIHQQVIITMRHLLRIESFTIQELSLYPSEGEHIIPTKNEQQHLLPIKWSDVNGLFQLSLI